MQCLGMMMVVVHNKLKCMYIHYELCILRFYEACLGLVGFCLWPEILDHDKVGIRAVGCLSSVQWNDRVVDIPFHPGWFEFI